MGDWATGIEQDELDWLIETMGMSREDLEADVSRRQKRDGSFERLHPVPSKAGSPESRLKTCHECGCYGGRHLRVCSKWATASADPPFRKGSGDASG